MQSSPCPRVIPPGTITTPISSLDILRDHNIRLESRAACDHVRLGHQTQHIKCLVSLKSDDFTASTRDLRYTPIHILAVIDVSGSMSGNKIQLVKRSLEYVLTKMTGQDRMTLISFSEQAKMLAEFQESSTELGVKVRSLNADGSTNIKAGVDLAYKTILKYEKERMLHSVWVLSDGQDTKGFSGEQVAPHLREHFLGKSVPFIIHTFGYGADHDPKIMKKLAQERSGSFKYIEDSSHWADAVGNALGGAESAIARKVTLKVGEGASGLSKIEKCFGESFEYDPFSKEYSTVLYYFRAGSNNGFVFTVELPSFNPKLSLPPTPSQILSVTAILQPLNPDEPALTLSCPLSLPILDPTSPGLPFRPLDPQVLEWYYRVVSIDQMRKSSTLMDQHNHTEARKTLQALDRLLEQSAPDTGKIREIRGNVKAMIQQIDKREYEEGRRRMTERAMHYEGCYDSYPCKIVEKIIQVPMYIERPVGFNIAPTEKEQLPRK